MNLFMPALNQLAFLFGFIAIGYLLIKCGVIPKESPAVLSKLENNIFIPALVMGTFIESFTVEHLTSAWKIFIASFIIAVIVIPFAILVSKSLTKDKYIQNLYTYGLSFSNSGFMGNAVVSGLFPDIFFEYLIFTVPLQILTYLWGVPKLLMADSGKKQTLAENLKVLVNPMFIGMFIGMLIGLAKINLPTWLLSLITVSGDCMSPIAMLLTGMVAASISLEKAFADIRVYIVSVIRLIVLPLLFIFIASFLQISETIYICAVCALSMPLGLNSIVIPSALGKDTSVAAGMTIISHLLSCITIPLIFTII